MGFLGRINEMFKDDDSYLEEEENFNVADENAEETYEEKAAPAAAQSGRRRSPDRPQ